MQPTERYIPNTLDGELFRRKMRNDYGTYVQYVNADQGFYMTHFHRYLCNEIQDFLETPTDKAMDILLLSVPPRHGKSYTVTETLPSWFLGKNPDSEVIICSYEGTFAESFSRRNRDKFNLYAQDIFRVKPNNNVQGVALWETENGGRCRAAGLKAGITGYGADLFIIDDPIKNQEAAMSEAIISKIHDEMGPSVQSRIHPGGKLIVIQTRWVENDVIGYIEANWGEYIYKNINLPCECEDELNDPLGRHLGDSLMGEHLGDNNLPRKIRNDNAWLQSKKRLVLAGDGEHVWNALYQGHPTAQQGNLYKDLWWKKYRRSDMHYEDFDFACLSVDATFKASDTGDFVAIELWCLKNQDAYLWKLINKRMTFIQTVEAIKHLVNEIQVDELIIEDKANGSAIIDTLHYIADMPTIVGVNPLGGKYSRAQATSQYVAEGHCYIPCDFTYEESLDIEWDGSDRSLSPQERFVKQHSTFPFAKHDDMVDAQDQALSRLIKLATGEEPLPERHYQRFVHYYDDMWDDFNALDEAGQVEYIRQYGAPEEWAEYAD